MELKEFIKTALTDITNAVKECQCEIKNSAIIPPPISTEIGGVNQRIAKYKIYDIDFDVAITANNDIGKSKRIGLEVWGLGYKNVDTDGYGSSVSSRIKFSIPVVYPASGDEEIHHKSKPVMA